MQESNTINLFFELLQVAIGTNVTLSKVPTTEQWNELFELSKKQTLMGVAFTGIEKLPSEQRPPKNLLLNWYNICNIIEKQNNVLNKQAVAVAKKFKEEGFDNIILKGQGIATLYENPARRTAGDIDIWLDADRKRIMSYVRKFIPDAEPIYHHVDFPIHKDLCIEIHFTPSWMYNYFTNRKLQRYFRKVIKEQLKNRVVVDGEGGTISAPTLEFNRIYILLHIYRHLFQEGIGLRQMLDYYHILVQGFTKEEQIKNIAQLKEFKMQRFAGAAMWVLKRVFNIEDKYMIVEPLENEGKELLAEIIKMGNFGKYNPEFEIQQKGNILQRAISRTKQNMSMVRSYPSEILWAPLFRAWHFFWMKINK